MRAVDGAAVGRYGHGGQDAQPVILPQVPAQLGDQDHAHDSSSDCGHDGADGHEAGGGVGWMPPVSPRSDENQESPVSSPRSPHNPRTERRGPGCRGSCPSLGTHRTSADPGELCQVIDALSVRKPGLVLQANVVVGGEEVKAGARLVEVSRHCRLSSKDRRKVVAIMQAAIHEDQCLRLGFVVEPADFPVCVVAQCPCCICLSVVLATLSFIAVGLTFGGTLIMLNTNFDSFMDSDGPASLKHSAIIQAMTDHAKEVAMARGKRRLNVEGLYKEYRVHITYASADSTNVLSDATIQEMRDMEAQLKSLATYQEMASELDPPLEAYGRIGISLANAAYPARRHLDGKTSQLDLNGTGTEALPLSVAVEFGRKTSIVNYVLPKEAADAPPPQLAIDSASCVDKADDCAQWLDQCGPMSEHELYMKDFCAHTCGHCGRSSPSGTRSNSTQSVALRSHFFFKKLCCLVSDTDQRGKVAQLNVKWEAFVADAVRLLLGKSNRLGLHVFVNGDSVEGYVAMQAVQGDLLWAVGSYCFVCCYAMLHTRSAFLAFTGLFIVMLSIPLAVAIFKIASGSDELSLMMLLSIFIVVGIGSDMLFVYTDSWKHSLAGTRHVSERLRRTYRSAALSTLATTFTTSMSFMANLASALRPLREFGFFMGVCVLSAWLLILLAYPPMLIVGERLHRKVRSMISHCPSSGGREWHSEDSDDGASGGPLVVQKTSSRVSDMLDPEKEGVGQVHHKLLGQMLPQCVHAARCTIAVFFVLLTVLSLWMSVAAGKMDRQVPTLFQPDHPWELSKGYDALFNFIEWSTVFNDVDLKRVYSSCDDIYGSCDLHTCATSGRPVGNASRCQCFAHGSQPTPYCSSYWMRMYAAGPEGSFSAAGYSASEFRAYLDAQFSRAYPNAEISMSEAGVAMSKLHMEHWESGDQRLAARMLLPEVTVKFNNGAPGGSCDVRQVCYCGVEACDADEMGSTERKFVGVLGMSDLLQQPGPSKIRRLDEPVLQRTSIAPHLRADIIVVFGVNPCDDCQPTLGVSSRPLYSYSDTFRLEDPWAQRRIVAMCETWPASLMIVAQECWILPFKTWWMQKGEDFPLRRHIDFHGAVHTFINEGSLETGSTRQVADLVWFDYAKQRVKAMIVQVYVGMSRNAGQEQSSPLYEAWNSYIDDFNKMADASYGGVWHASRLWVSSEAQRVILSSTVDTIGISLSCVLLGVLAFTQSLQLAIIVMLCVMAIIASLLFYMVIWLGWAIGAIEVLSLIVFVGFAVDYCLHVAHKYHVCHVVAVEEEECVDAVHAADSKGVSSFCRLPCCGGAEGDSCESTAQDSSRTGSCHGSPEKLTQTQVDQLAPTAMLQSSHRLATRVKIRIAETASSTHAPGDTLSREERELLRGHRRVERYERTCCALRCMGASVIGSAITTLGCAVFLLPCKLVIFWKIGSVVIGVTLYAVVYTLLPLPAVLMMIGPCESDQTILSKLLGQRQTFQGKAGKPARNPVAQEVAKGNDRDGATVVGRRYVLNMPARGMSEANRESMQASRTRITATGCA